MRGALSVDGRNQLVSVAWPPATRAGTMSDECRLELWAESIAPSRICAQLQGTITLAIETRAFSCGAQGGGTNSATWSAGPNQAQTMPPHSLTG